MKACACVAARCGCFRLLWRKPRSLGRFLALQAALPHARGMLKWTLMALVLASALPRSAGAAVAQDANAAAAQDANAAVSQDANAANAAVSQDANAANAANAQDTDASEPEVSQMSQSSQVLQKRTLLISSNPVGARVTVNDAELGVTPLTVDVAALGNPNSVTVRWTRYNCDPQEMQVLLDPHVAETDVGAFLVRRKQHALGAQYNGYFGAGIAGGGSIFYRYYLPYNLFVTAGLGATTLIGSTDGAIPLIIGGIGYDTGGSHDDPELPGLDRSTVAFTPSLEAELFGPPGLGAVYIYPVSVRAYYAFASFGIGYQFSHNASYSGFGCRLNVGAQWLFF